MTLIKYLFWVTLVLFVCNIAGSEISRPVSVGSDGPSSDLLASENLDEDKRGNQMFRWGKRSAADGTSQIRSNMFRWGKRADDLDELQEALMNERYKKDGSQMFRWGKRNEKSQKAMFRWGKRGEPNVQMFRWGKRDSYSPQEASSPDFSSYTDIPGKRGAANTMFRWGRSPNQRRADLERRKMFMWGKRSAGEPENMQIWLPLSEESL